MSSDTESASSKSAGSHSGDEQSTTHYNDWPNSQGFDVRYEERKPIPLDVTGKIPAYAAGVLFRTSVGPRDIYDKATGELRSRTSHWFDSISQTHRFQIHAPAPGSDKVTVTYNSRLSSDGLIEKIEKTGESTAFTFAAKYDPCKSVFSKMAAFFTSDTPGAPNEIVNAVTMSVNYPGVTTTGEALHGTHQSGNIVTLCNRTDRSRLQMLDPNTLEPIGIAYQTVLHPSLSGLLSGAHAKSDPVTGDVYNFNLDIAGPMTTYRVFRTSASTGQTCILASIKHAPAYLHSIFISENYIIMCVWNSHFKAGGVSILYNKNLVEAMYHNDKQPATWYVIDKRDPVTECGRGCVAVYESDPFFAFHSINAVEEPNAENKNEIDIVADIPTWPNMDVIRHFVLDNLMSSSPTARQLAPSGLKIMRPVITRYRLGRVPKLDHQMSSQQSKAKLNPLKSTNISALPRQRAQVDFKGSQEDAFELPTLNFNYICKPYRYIYGIVFASGEKSCFVDGLIKYDLTNHTKLVWEKYGHTPGEAIFVPDPNGTQEDDGVLLTVVLDGKKDSSYLLVLDARTMTEVGRADVPGVVGFGFHGVFTRLKAGIDGANGEVPTKSAAASEKVRMVEIAH